MLRKLLRPAVLLPGAVTIALLVVLALRHSSPVWFAILVGGVAALPAIAIHFSRNAGKEKASPDDTSKPE